MANHHRNVQHLQCWAELLSSQTFQDHVVSPSECGLIVSEAIDISHQ